MHKDQRGFRTNLRRPRRLVVSQGRASNEPYAFSQGGQLQMPGLGKELLGMGEGLVGGIA